MQLLLESTAVSIYVLLLSFAIPNIFLLGFTKHFLPGALGVHVYYCNYKFNSHQETKLTRLLMESILEGLLFTAIHNVLSLRYSLSSMIIGFVLHYTFDIYGIHQWFCKA